MEIRKVLYNELESVLELFDEFERAPSPRPSFNEMQQIYKRLEYSRGCVLGAFEDYVLLGTCTLNICANFSWSGRPYAMIENVIVTMERRAQGVGKSLLQAAIAEAKRLGCFKIALMTDAEHIHSHGFFEASGFNKDDTAFQIRFDLDDDI